MRRGKSASGPSRHFVAKQRFCRFWKEADIKWQVGPASSVANDPLQTSNAPLDLIYLLKKGSGAPKGDCVATKATSAIQLAARNSILRPRAG
jgi:hypothetical protein